MKTDRFVTMRQVAEAAGVACSTVSKALRDDPSIPARRCANIQKLARELGYRPHPMVSALMAQLHQLRRRSDPIRLAWIDLWPAREKPVPIVKPLFQGARKRAYELGYGLEVHRVAADGIRPERLRQILISRSQWGLIIPPVPESAMQFALDMRGLAGVTIGTSLHHPVMHRVSPNHYQGGQMACRQLRAKGFRRIGLVLSPGFNERVEGKWLAACLALQQHWPAIERLPPLLVDVNGNKALRSWMRRHKPDAILMSEPHVSTWLRAAARVGDGRPAVVWLALEEEMTNVWGIDYQAEHIGAAAVELVVGQIHRNERGSPPTPHTLLLDGVWAER